MAAGLGFKDFVTGEVLTAADVDGYLMQGIWVFASAAARDSAVTSPQEGNFAYLKDTNTTTYYTGSAWTNLDTTGMVNPMTTTGDTIYSSSGSTPARLGIGSTGQVLTVAGGVPSWATPASSGGMTLLDTITLSGASVTSTTFSSSYKQLIIYIANAYANVQNRLDMRFNGDTGSNYSYTFDENADTVDDQSMSATSFRACNISGSSTTLQRSFQIYTLMRPSDSGGVVILGQGQHNSGGSETPFLCTGAYNGSSAITSVTIYPNSGSFTAGTAYIYGVN